MASAASIIPMRPRLDHPQGVAYFTFSLTEVPLVWCCHAVAGIYQCHLATWRVSTGEDTMLTIPGWFTLRTRFSPLALAMQTQAPER
jgi:hypothetical protein